MLIKFIFLSHSFIHTAKLHNPSCSVEIEAECINYWLIKKLNHACHKPWTILTFEDIVEIPYKGTLCCLYVCQGLFQLIHLSVCVWTSQMVQTSLTGVMYLLTFHSRTRILLKKKKSYPLVSSTYISIKRFTVRT